eukprot:TRINITY_DN4533_c0_g1_i1.p1 TRINITY_DN4533_c0_g1~~TRINITY_DN4533_c0_g1_i1.p1  ORF type:complete len:107 (-),score=30.32 TRINITY_DN4533_c0_g1_i1:148-468(-)
MVVSLLDQGNVTIDSVNESQSTLLHWAVDRGNLELTEILIDMGSNINFQNENGETPLHIAVLCEYDDIVKLLLEKGADTSVVDNENETVFDSASKKQAELLAEYSQ